MNDAYEDIKSRIKEQPTWYDVYGAPRYGEIPDDLKEHIRRIKCQSCGQVFTVCLVHAVYHTFRAEMFDFVPVSYETVQLRGRSYRLPALYRCVVTERGVPNHWHYGDPPCHGCVGDTMNSEPEYTWEEATNA